MFTHEENEILTRVGPGTPMGELIRRYWIPAFLSEELPEPDCPPVRTRLLGEDLVGFRDSLGRVGLLSEYCSHRRASLFYGRNEECGLRCVYHGWKYGVEGNVVETPNEPPESQLGRSIHHTAYPCVEVNRLVLTYMGPPHKKPLVPALPWLTMPTEQVCVGCKFFLECNWVQSLEGDLDSIHTSYLHRRQRGQGQRQRPRAGYVRDVEIDWLPYGVRGAQIFPTVDKDHVQVQTNTFFMPCIGTIGDGNHIVYQVPADEYTCWRYDIIVSTDGPISDQYAIDYREESWPSAAGGRLGWQRKMTRQNDYLIDRTRQKSGETFCGVDARNHTQDAMVTENMGPLTGPGSIVDRNLRNLGVSDRLLIAMHQFLLKAVRGVQEGKDAPGVAFRPEDNTFPGARGISTDVLVGQSWRELMPA